MKSRVGGTPHASCLKLVSVFGAQSCPPRGARSVQEEAGRGAEGVFVHSLLRDQLLPALTLLLVDSLKRHKHMQALYRVHAACRRREISFANLARSPCPSITRRLQCWTKTASAELFSCNSAASKQKRKHGWGIAHKICVERIFANATTSTTHEACLWRRGGSSC